jgi:uncharacterized protein (TIGR03437 family)
VHQPIESSRSSERAVYVCLRAVFILATGAALFAQSSGLIVNGLTAAGAGPMFWSNAATDGTIQPGSAVYDLSSGGLHRITSLGLAVQAETAQHRPSAYAVSPDGSQIAVSNDSGLTVVDTATGATALITAPGLGEHLHFSPDGQTIFFTVAPFTGHYWFPYLYSAPVTGGSAMRLVRGALDGRHPISADGTIVFTSPSPSDDVITTTLPANVYAMKADGSNFRQLTNYTGLAYQAPSATQASITPDGKRILFVVRTPTPTPLSLTAAWVIQADGTGLRSLPIDNRTEVVAFSRDGTRMAWSRAGIVHVQNVDTGDDRVVTEFAQSDIAEMDFTADNSRLYLLIGEPNAYGYRPIGAAVWSVDPASGATQILYAPRTLSPSGIAGASSLAPGGFVTAYAANLISADSLLVPSTFPLPQSLGGISLTINGRAVPILAVTPWQVNAEIPMDTPLGPASIALQFAGGTSTPAVAVTVVGSSPVQFTTATGCAFHGDTGLVADEAHPAIPGEILVMYGTGLGVTSPSIPAGAVTPVSPLTSLVNPVSLFIGNYPSDQQAKILFAGLSPGSIALYQVNFQLPDATPAGAARVVWSTTVGGRIGGCSLTVQ